MCSAVNSPYLSREVKATTIYSASISSLLEQISKVAIFSFVIQMIIERQLQIKMRRIDDQVDTSFGQLCTLKMAGEARAISVNRNVHLLSEYLSLGRLMFEIFVFSLDDLVTSIEPVKRLRSIEDIEVIL